MPSGFLTGFVVFSYFLLFAVCSNYGSEIILYVTDQNLGSIRKVFIANSFVSTLAPNSSLSTPTGLALSCKPFPTFNYDMMAYYRFESGNAFLSDSSGNGPALTLTGLGAPTQMTSGCIMGGCALINATLNQHFRLGGSIAFASYDGFSISAWFLPGPNVLYYQRLFDFGTGAPAGVVENEIAVVRYATTDILYLLILSNNTHLVDANIADSFPTGRWTHFCLTMSAGRYWNAYINGTRKAGGTMTAALNKVMFTYLFVGVSQTAWNTNFDGMLDELRIYRKALLEEEVVSLFQWRGSTLTTNSSFSLVVAESGRHTIRAVSLRSGGVTTVAGNASSGFQDGVNALFSSPAAVAASKDGSFIIVADQGNYALRKIDASRAAVSTLAGTGAPGLTDGVKGVGTFLGPAGVAISPDGASVYVTDVAPGGAGAVRVVSLLDGTVATLAGGAGRGLRDGAAGAAMFAGPRGLAVSSDGVFIYVADSGNAAVRRVVAATGDVATVAGGGGGGAGFADGPTLIALFSDVSDVVLSEDGGFLYVADPGNDAVRRIETATLLVTTLAGGAGLGSEDGAGGAARFRALQRLAVAACSAARAPARPLEPSRLPPFYPGSGPCERTNLTWQEVLERELESAWTGGLGLLVTRSQQAWVCLNVTCGEPANATSARFPDMPCYTYNEQLQLFVHWGNNAVLKLYTTT